MADHLGSVDTILDSAGAVLERLSFDPWGKRRQADWKAFMAGTGYLWQSSVYTRGYTGHEQLDPVDLVHMNGRVYDAELGRFLSTDPVIQDTTNLQNLNPYSYVLNNPLSFTDPSGFFFSKLFKAIGNFFKKIFRAIGNVFKAILNSQIVRAIIQIAACAAVGPACAAVTAGITLLAGGSIAESIQAGIFSFISAGVWTGVGQILKPILAGLDLVSAIGVKGVVHGVVGGALSVAQGGSFTDGFVANAVGAGAGLLSSGTAVGSNIYTDTAAVALAGGLAAELTGGKFANGAITAAFANIFNKWAAMSKEASARLEYLKTNSPTAAKLIQGVEDSPWEWTIILRDAPDAPDSAGTNLYGHYIYVDSNDIVFVQGVDGSFFQRGISLIMGHEIAHAFIYEKFGSDAALGRMYDDAISYENDISRELGQGRPDRAPSHTAPSRIQRR